MQNQYNNRFQSKHPQNDLFQFLFSFIKNSFAVIPPQMADQFQECAIVPSSPYLKKMNGINAIKNGNLICINI